MPDKNKKLNDKELKKVHGGWRFINDEQEKDYYNDIHYGCGGHIKNHGNIFKSCECEKCHEKHYMYDSFFNFQPTGEGPFF